VRAAKVRAWISHFVKQYTATGRLTSNTEASWNWRVREGSIRARQDFRSILFGSTFTAVTRVQIPSGTKNLQFSCSFI
jgi:hypothetical protein